jgi:hypothetical protein
MIKPKIAVAAEPDGSSIMSPAIFNATAIPYMAGGVAPMRLDSDINPSLRDMLPGQPTGTLPL